MRIRRPVGRRPVGRRPIGPRPRPRPGPRPIGPRPIPRSGTIGPRPGLIPKPGIIGPRPQGPFLPRQPGLQQPIRQPGALPPPPGLQNPDIKHLQHPDVKQRILDIQKNQLPGSRPRGNIGGIRPGVRPGGIRPNLPFASAGGMGPLPNNLGPMQGVGDPRSGAATIPGNKLQMQMRGPAQAAPTKPLTAMKKGGYVSRGVGKAIKGKKFKGVF
jgi:hypothetical protein